MTTQTIKSDDLKRKDREFRMFEEFEVRAVQPDTTVDGAVSQELYVEGYACTFNQPTVLFECDGIEYKEQVDSKSFVGTDMSDVIFNYDHAGKVMARTRNRTLTLNIDDRGLFVRARLDGTEEGRELYGEIKDGYIDRMSFCFSIKESSYDSENRMRTILAIKKLYDVSAVSIPAYDSTSISARSYFEAQLELENEEKAREQALRKKLIIHTYL